MSGTGTREYEDLHHRLRVCRVRDRGMLRHGSEVVLVDVDLAKVRTISAASRGSTQEEDQQFQECVGEI